MLENILSSDFLNQYGIVDWGIVDDPIPISYQNYEKWIEQGRQGPLTYLSDDRKDKRADIRHVYQQFQSSIVFLFSYLDEKIALNNYYQSKKSNGLKISGYVFGFNQIDYHDSLKLRLNEIALNIKHHYPELEYQLALDVWPVLERDLAYRAGLGWFGKNSMLINKKQGSFHIIGSLLLNQKLKKQITSNIKTDHCGNCVLCAIACPTKAIDIKSRTIDSAQCISTYTIEMFKKDAPKPLGLEQVKSEIFGCDICQDVCPWNKRIIKNKNSNEIIDSSLVLDFFLVDSVEKIILKLEKMSNRSFKRMFKGTPLARTGRLGLLKNILALQK